MGKGDPKRQKVMREVFQESVLTILEREAMYGSGSDNVGGALASMFPGGLELRTADDFARFFDFSLTVAKLNRYAQSFPEGGHEDSIHDAGNYAKLLEVKDRLIRAADEEEK